MQTADRDPGRELDRTADRLARRRTGVVLAAGWDGRTHVAARGDSGRASTPGPSLPDHRTLFEIGSVTKTVTSLLLARGVVDGLWRLNTPVRELLPAGVAVPARDGSQITLQHLATHTAGLPRSPRRLGLRENVDYLLSGADPYAGLDEAAMLESVGRAKLNRRPGTGRPRYSNLGFGLLGSALCAATGRDFGTLVQEWVTGPLGMPDTVTEQHMTFDQRDRMAVGHRSRSRPAEPWPLPGMPGAGALRSTARDMLTYLEAQARPADTPLAEAILLTHTAVPGGPPQMGLGWHLADECTLWHNGGTGGFRTIAIVSPRSRILLVGLVNQTRGVDLSAFLLFRRISG